MNYWEIWTVLNKSEMLLSHLKNKTMKFSINVDLQNSVYVLTFTKGHFLLNIHEIFGVDIYNRKAAFIRQFLLINILEYPVEISL